MLKVAVIGVIGSMLALLLKGERAEQGLWVILASCLLILGMSLSRIESILSVVHSLEESLGEGALYLQVLLKMIGIAYVAEFGSGLCKDAGYGAVAGQIEFFGKLMLLAVSMPVIQNLITLIGTIGG
ncbi:MAG: stage III sporulation AC/AD family protein [Lachnospiraceae bacterium]|nr:stage III sporulation AC/AD family protein [Lachnospiraceae bacterium]